MGNRYIPSKEIFTDLAVIYCPSCKTNHYILTSPTCGLHKVEQCNEIQRLTEVAEQ